jgi:hypothetical protein
MSARSFLVLFLLNGKRQGEGGTLASADVYITIILEFRQAFFIRKSLYFPVNLLSWQKLPKNEDGLLHGPSSFFGFFSAPGGNRTHI